MNYWPRLTKHVLASILDTTCDRESGFIIGYRVRGWGIRDQWRDETAEQRACRLEADALLKKARLAELEVAAEDRRRRWVGFLEMRRQANRNHPETKRERQSRMLAEGLERLFQRRVSRLLLAEPAGTIGTGVE